jgi:hypothetical protein
MSVRCHEPTSPMQCCFNEKAARRRLLNSKRMIVDQAASKWAAAPAINRKRLRCWAHDAVRHVRNGDHAVFAKQSLGQSLRRLPCWLRLTQQNRPNNCAISLAPTLNNPSAARQRGTLMDNGESVRRFTPAGFSCPAAMSPPNLAHGNENHFCVRLLPPGSGQQLGMGSRPRQRRRRRQAIDARRRSRPLRNLLESAPDVDEEGP